MNDASLRFPITVGGSLNKAWDAVTRSFWPMVGFTFLYFVASALLEAIPFVGTLANLFDFILYVSFFAAFDSYDRRGDISFGDFFNWTPKFGRLFLAYLITLAIALVLFLPLILYIIFSVGAVLGDSFSPDFRYMMSYMPTNIILVILLYTLVAGVLLLVFTFALLFIAWSTDMPLGAALRHSFRIGRENFGQIVLFVLLAVGLIILGLIALIIGIFFTIPLIAGAQYYLLRSIFPIDDTQQWDFMATGNQSL